ncbi:MAG: putative toxin-antitoxin system toxin component, PIN family [Gemmatimonadales bacterium]
MRVIVDTNVLLSGIFFGGVPGRILDAWVAGRFELVLSPGILAEYSRAGGELAARYPERGDALSPVLTLVAMNATLVDAPPLGRSVSRDSDDDTFLAAAHHAGVAVIVSGDRDLRDISGWEGILVLSPRQFVDQHLLAG